MYRDSDFSAQAKRLHAELTHLGVEMTYAQSMELLARTQGARTLHVAKARNHKQGVELAPLAERLAADIVFLSLGSYQDCPVRLLDDIDRAFALESAHGSRAVEARVHEIFGTPHSPRLRSDFEVHRLSEIPEVFRNVLSSVKASLDTLFEAPVQPLASQEWVYPMTDWRAAEGEPLSDLPLRERGVFEARVVRQGAQLSVDIAPAHREVDELEGKDQLSLFIEIDHGHPRVVITNRVYGDQVLAVYGLSDGLLLEPMFSSGPGSRVQDGAGTPAAAELVATMANETEDTGLARRVSCIPHQ